MSRPKPTRVAEPIEEEEVKGTTFIDICDNYILLIGSQQSNYCVDEPLVFETQTLKFLGSHPLL